MQTPQSKNGINRRLVVVAGFAGALIDRVASGVAGNFAYDALTKREVKTDVLQLFPSFAKTQLVPGSHHPEEGFHPDVRDALNGIAPVLAGLHSPKYVGFANLPPPDRAKNMLLLGGPISNEVSRELHGHSFIGHKISPLPTKRDGFRWHFYYPEYTPGDPAYSRYVAGELKPKMRKVLIDSRASSGNAEINSECFEDGSIESDYLLITVQQNFLHPGSGTKIIEVADLQGQGDKVFSQILTNEALLHELHAKSKATMNFQALYRVSVTHDTKNSETKPGVPVLEGFATFA